MIASMVEESPERTCGDVIDPFYRGAGVGDHLFTVPTFEIAEAQGSSSLRVKHPHRFPDPGLFLDRP